MNLRGNIKGSVDRTRTRPRPAIQIGLNIPLPYRHFAYLFVFGFFENLALVDTSWFRIRRVLKPQVGVGFYSCKMFKKR
jgi:hypothetical protein